MSSLTIRTVALPVSFSACASFFCVGMRSDDGEFDRGKKKKESTLAINV